MTDIDLTRMRGSRPLRYAVLFLAVTALSNASGSAEAQANKTVRTVNLKSDDEIHQFCSNIADDAKELRYARKAAELRQLQDKVEARIALLEEKNREFEAWIERRNKFQKQAQEGLVDIYAKMRPDAAAARLELLGIELAAAILMKLSARQAGVILNEMDANKAALVTGIISAAGQRRDPA